MRFLLLGILLFIFYGAASAQPIFIPHKGERELVKIQEIKDVDTTRMGQPCGDYFLYEIVNNSDGTTEKVVSLEVSKMEGDRSTTPEFLHIGRKQLIIKQNEKVKIPTAEWKKNNLILKISPEDYKMAECLKE